MKQSYSYKISKSISLGINIIIHMLILFAFLTVLYFFLIAPLEKKSFNDEISAQVKDNITKQLKQMKENIDPEISDEINNIVNYKSDSGVYAIDELIEYYSFESPDIKEHNNWITSIAISVIFILTLGLIIYLNTLSNTCNKQTGIISIVKENIITFIFIGLAEYLFFTEIAFKYVPAPPSVLVKSLLNSFTINL